MQQSVVSKRVPKLTERAKAGLEEQNKGTKKRMNAEKGGEAAPKKARPDQENGSDDMNSEAEESSQATAPNAWQGAQAIDTGDIDASQDSSDELEIIEPRTSQSKGRMEQGPVGGSKGDIGELKWKVRCHQLTVEQQRR